MSRCMQIEKILHKNIESKELFIKIKLVLLSEKWRALDWCLIFVVTRILGIYLEKTIRSISQNLHFTIYRKKLKYNICQS